MELTEFTNSGELLLILQHQQLDIVYNRGLSHTPPDFVPCGAGWTHVVAQGLLSFRRAASVDVFHASLQTAYANVKS